MGPKDPEPDPDRTEPLEPLDHAPVGVARVNLLPPEIVQERRQRLIAIASVSALVVYLLVLGGVYVRELIELADARDTRDDVQVEVAALQAELDGLAEYRRLVEDIEAHETLLSMAMADELSWARVFGELALSFNRDASLVELQAVTTEPGAGEHAPDDEELDDPRVGEVTFTGYSIERVAPGVQGVLEQIVEGDSLFDSYLITTANEERGAEEVTGFEARVELSRDAYTHRYEEGLPQESMQ